MEGKRETFRKRTKASPKLDNSISYLSEQNTTAKMKRMSNKIQLKSLEKPEQPQHIDFTLEHRVTKQPEQTESPKQDFEYKVHPMTASEFEEESGVFQGQILESMEEETFKATQGFINNMKPVTINSFYEDDDEDKIND